MTLRRLSQPRTSTTPVVSVIVTTAARADAGMRCVMATSVIVPLASPLTTTDLPASRNLMVEAGSGKVQREKLFPLVLHSS